MDCFSLLSLEHTFDVALSTLEKSYFQAQRRYHPDRFISKSPSERHAALQRSADVNKAYNTLKNPLLRAQHLLHLQGIAIGTEKDAVKPNMALLEETMQWRETVAALDKGDMADHREILQSMITQSIQSIGQSFTAKRWDAMAQETLRLGYLLKAQDALVKRMLNLSAPL